MFNKITRIKKMIDDKNLNVDIQVDGGINEKTVAEVAKAGANIMVTGSAFFNSQDPEAFVNLLKERGHN